MSRFLSTFVCAALLAAGCGRNPNNPEVSFPATLTVQFGQTASAGGLDVTFVEVNDSRCPLNATCISAGDALLQLTLAANGRSVNADVRAQEPGGRTASFEGYSVEVKLLAPYPDTSRAMSKSEYKVTLEVRR